MICNKCGNEVPDFAVFCTNCGNRIEKTEPVVEEPVPVYEPPTPIYEHTPQTKQPEIPKAEPKGGFGAYLKRNLVLLIVAAVLLTFTVCLGIFALMKNAEIKDIEEYNREIIGQLTTAEEQNTALTEENQQLQSQKESVEEELNLIKEQYAEAMGTGMLYEDLYFNLTDGISVNNIGMASEQFYLSDGVIVLDPGDVEEIQLYTKNDGEGTISYTVSGTCAYMAFTENSWEEQTTLRITAKEERGVSVFSISSTHEAEPVRLVVVVR